MDFNEPTDESPIDTPDIWTGGSVETRGGGFYLRAWRTFEENTEQEKPAYEVLYNLTQEVALQEYEWNGENYVLSKVIVVVEIDDNSEQSHLEAASKLIEIATDLTNE